MFVIKPENSSHDQIQNGTMQFPFNWRLTLYSSENRSHITYTRENKHH